MEISVSPEPTTPTCAICLSAINDEELGICRICGTLAHSNCAERINRACPRYGCQGELVVFQQNVLRNIRNQEDLAISTLNLQVTNMTEISSAHIVGQFEGSYVFREDSRFSGKLLMQLISSSDGNEITGIMKMFGFMDYIHDELDKDYHLWSTHQVVGHVRNEMLLLQATCTHYNNEKTSLSGRLTSGGVSGDFIVWRRETAYIGNWNVSRISDLILDIRPPN